MTDAARFDPPRQLALRVGLRDDATLDNFYPRCNPMAVSVVEALGRGEGEASVYLWGAAGSGGSHLLQAACHSADALGRSSLYLPVDQVIDYGPDVLEGLESLDLVCIDHLQGIAGRPEWEEGLFHLFNRLRDGGGQLLMAADRPPRQLPVVLADLASRLGWGLVLQLQPLDDDAKVRALRLRARRRGFHLGDEVARYILHRSPRDPAALFALLERLDSASLSAKRRITIPFIKATLGW